MTLFDHPIGPETYSAIRFGCGLPLGHAPVGAGAILNRLKGPDRMLRIFPRTSFEAGMGLGRDLRRALAEMRGGSEGAAALANTLRIEVRTVFAQDLASELARNIETADPFRERLHRFWTNHFSARASGFVTRAGGAGYADEAIRPFLTGHFADLLKAAVTHPFMLLYLNQVGSFGPNSQIGMRRKRGLNENLAREVMELHTLGVSAPYGQSDVRQLAELFTGLHYSFQDGAVFDARFAEPGAETVLGKSYGGGRPGIADIHAVLDDLSRHPSTAAHICRKLATHFVSDNPDPDLIASMIESYRRSDGLLTEVYAAMLAHPAAWRDFGGKVKTPMDFMTSALRALGIQADQLTMAEGGVKRLTRDFLAPLRVMGQPYQQPPGPDGFTEDPEAWIQPHRLAARIAWAMRAARRVDPRLSDPRNFVARVLGDASTDGVIWAAGAAETRTEGIGVVLASAEFNRR